MASKQLLEARQALHDFNLGKRVVTLSRDGKSVTFNALNVGVLRQYIMDLERAEGDHGAGRRGPAGVF